MPNDTLAAPIELTDAELDTVGGGQNNAGGNGVNVIVQDVIDDINVNITGNQIGVAVAGVVRQNR